jgi:hypothetical protein
MIKLTRPDGSFVYVSPGHILLVRPPLKTENGKCVVELIKGAQSCKEDMETVVAAIELGR